MFHFSPLPALRPQPTKIDSCQSRTPAPCPQAGYIDAGRGTEGRGHSTCAGLGGQSAGLARAEPAADVVKHVWDDARALLV